MSQEGLKYSTGSQNSVLITKEFEKAQIWFGHKKGFSIISVQETSVKITQAK